MEKLSQRAKADLLWKWRNWWARPSQCAPEGDWTNWLVMAGRGFGKTRAGAEWIREQEERGAMHIALVAETAADARDVMVEGRSGILAVSPPDRRPLYEPSKRRLTWPSGAVATIYNATEPDQLRGPEHEVAWVDELAKFNKAQDLMDNLWFGLRVGDKPRAMITTTPRPVPIIRKLVGDPETRVTVGSTFENSANLPPSFIQRLRDRYEGTRLGRQELLAEILDDIPGALWNREMIIVEKLLDTEENPALDRFRRIVVAVDPSGTGGEEDDGDEVGIVVAGEDRSGLYWVLEDATMKAPPATWASTVATLYDKWRADVVVAERNYGGEMVRAVLKAAKTHMHVRMVTASRGKFLRAEPVAAVYEQKRVRHVPELAMLEDEMMQITPSGYMGEGSPNRLDALVWAMTDLAVSGNTVEIEEMIL